MDYLRQQDLVDQQVISSYPISIIGCGALGSASAMALAKMGVNDFTLYDEDGITDVNLPNQMYFPAQIGQFKVDALAQIIKEINTDAKVISINKNYTDQLLTPIVIVTTDSMISRKVVWEQFRDQNKAHVLIEARMGAEEGQVYTIVKKPIIDSAGREDAELYEVCEEDFFFYQERLYDDRDAIPLPCTAKAIIYNVFMIASLVCRSFTSIIRWETFPREVVFGTAQIRRGSFLVRE